MKSCPHCNRPFPPNVVVGGVIRQRIFDYVRAHPAGVSTKQILGYVWQDDPEGGPESADVVSANVWHINDRLKRAGVSMRVRATQRAAGGVYKIFESGERHDPLGGRHPPDTERSAPTLPVR